MKKLVKKVFYTGVIKVVTGLHIGGTNASLNIGGPDNFVVRNPLNRKPYIPGSSLKGKMRALIEISEGCVSIENGKAIASNDPNSISGRLFGTATGKSNNRPSRLIVRDAELIVDREDDYSYCDFQYTESKTEVNIDRITAAAVPRTFERVPAGAKFRLNMVLNIFDDEGEKGLKETLEKAIRLLEADYLGGHGSRGYGQVKIELDNPDGEERTY